MSTVTQNRGLAAGGRRRDAVELGVTYVLVLAGCWTPRIPQRIIFWIAIGWVAAVLLARREDWKDLGLGWRGSLRSLWLVAAALAVGGIAVAAAAGLHTLHDYSSSAHRPLWPRACGYLLWAVVQQIVLQDVVLLRLLRLIRSRVWAVAIAAALFASAHLPNPLLVPLTIVWGALACWLFLRYRGIYTLGIAHAILGLAVALSFPNHIDHHMRVGWGYLIYRPPSAGVTHHFHVGMAGTFVALSDQGRVGPAGHRPIATQAPRALEPHFSQ